MPAEAVKVVVRCRPLNQRENGLKCKSVIQMDTNANACTINKPDARNASKSFTFDAVYNHKSMTSVVYDEIAFPLVESVIEGYNGTVFAYGQTGCGKTFTMEGVRNDPELRGITPRAFAHLFDKISVENDTKFMLCASYLEIYNEEIRDLLSYDHNKSLEVKEHPEKGVYVKELSQVTVRTPEDMEIIMDRGSRNRHVGATLMNADSSRSHSIYSITVEASTIDESGKEHFRAGKLNLVDLAGSERQGKTGAEGVRLKEATKINLSLSALGNVISALVDGKSTHIPYRDSKLTRLLQDSLGGNTKTLMIAAISPADNNYAESLSTLRYANRAKNIKNQAKINEDPKDAMLREYAEEIKRLKAMLTGQMEIPKDAQAVTTAILPPPERTQEELEELQRERLTYQEKMSTLKAQHREYETKMELLKEQYFEELEVLKAEQAREREDNEKLQEQVHVLKVHFQDKVGALQATYDAMSESPSKKSIRTTGPTFDVPPALDSTDLENGMEFTAPRPLSVSIHQNNAKIDTKEELEEDYQGEDKDEETIGKKGGSDDDDNLPSVGGLTGDIIPVITADTTERNKEKKKKKQVIVKKVVVKKTKKERLADPLEAALIAEAGFSLDDGNGEGDNSDFEEEVVEETFVEESESDHDQLTTEIPLKAVTRDAKEQSHVLKKKAPIKKSSQSSTKVKKQATSKNTSDEEANEREKFEEIDSVIDSKSDVPLKSTNRDACTEEPSFEVTPFNFAPEPSVLALSLRSKSQTQVIQDTHDDDEGKELEKMLREKNQLSKEKEYLLDKLRSLEKAMVTGGDSVDNQALKDELEHKRKVAETKRERRLQMLQDAQFNEDAVQLTHVFNDVQDEIKDKDRRLKKLKTKYDNSRAEAEDLQREFEAEREYWLETIRKQEREMALQASIIEKVVPCLRKDCNYTNVDRVRVQAKWDAENEEWILPKLSVEKTKLDALPGQLKYSNENNSGYTDDFESDDSERGDEIIQSYEDRHSEPDRFRENLENRSYNANHFVDDSTRRRQEEIINRNKAAATNFGNDDLHLGRFEPNNRPVRLEALAQLGPVTRKKKRR